MSELITTMEFDYENGIATIETHEPEPWEQGFLLPGEVLIDRYAWAYGETIEIHEDATQ